MSERQSEPVRDSDVTITGIGMLPDMPMARCSWCDSWSYLAAVGGRCLACVMSDSASSPSQNDGASDE